MNKHGRVSYASPSIRALGYKPTEIVGKTPSDLAHPDDIASIQKSVELSTRRPGKTVRMSDFRIRRRDGSWPLCEGFLTNLFDQPGVNGIVFNGRDITEKKRLQEFASRAQRLETAGKIAGQVAHDFNNLLGPLVAYPDIISDELRALQPGTPESERNREPNRQPDTPGSTYACYRKATG
jgi:two-component system sporulation sensor kinase A